MRKVISIVWILLLTSTLVAQAASINAKLFGNAKQAVVLTSYGEYGKAVKKLAFSANAPSASEWKEFAQENLSDIFDVTVQDTVAVAYRSGKAWRLAVPIEEPAYSGVQTLVLRSKDGKSFDAYRAMLWEDVLDEVAQADTVEWNEAYDGSDIYIVADEK